MQKLLLSSTMLILISTSCYAGSTSLARIVEPLKTKIETIIRECGSRVVSSDHRGGVTPNHRNHRAVDVSGNPQCIYSHLQDWPGGYSTDYNTAPYIKHVHISYCPPQSCRGGYEWGLRFAHAGSHSHQMSAKRHKRYHPQQATIEPTFNREQYY